MDGTTKEKRYLTCAETAKLVRKALKAEFPGQKFSVRSSNYAGGASIHVGWTDGPTEAEVTAHTDLYTGATFDGMIDLKSYHDSFLMGEDGPELVSFGADFIIPQRRISDELRATLAAEVEQVLGREFHTNERLPIYVGPEGDLSYLTNGATGEPDVAGGEWAETIIYQMSVRR